MKLKLWPHRKSKQTDEVQPEDTLHRLSRLSGEVEPSDQVLTRREFKTTDKGKYPLDPATRKLTPEGKRLQLRHRLNIAIIVLVVAIILVYLILFFM